MVEPVVTLQQGTLRGSIESDIYGSNYYSFQGIPFAKPPIGELRFKAPEPPEKWDGIWDATKERSGSYGRHLFKGHIIGSEDCLHLNVFTKTLPAERESKPKPVLVWIHGGALILGPSCGDTYRPDFLITEDVIIVTVCYRLGLLGFLSLEDSELGVPGNAGFKDMVMALKWVHDNIDQFNGDRNNVTIFGESAGALAVHLLVLSPMTKGLIHRGIIQSGSALNGWAEGESCTESIAKVLNLEGADEKTVLDKLITLPVEEILEIQTKTSKPFGASIHSIIGYVIENPKYGPAFITEKPLNIIRKGTWNKIPLIFGCTSAEGIFFEMFKKLAPLLGKVPDDSYDDFELNVPFLLGYQRGSKESKTVAENIKQFYYGDGDTLDASIRLFSDLFLVYLTYESAKNHARFSNSPVYYYRVSVDSALNFCKIMSGVKIPGASHCDELGYLFKNFATPEIKPGSLEDISMRRFVRLWANFARFGNPTPEPTDPLLDVNWKPVQVGDVDFLDIGENLSVGINPDGERMEFWSRLYKESPLGSKFVA